MKTSKKDILNYALIVFGAFLVGIGEACIQIPMKLTTGGFNGISMIIYYLLGFPVGIVSLLLNLPLIVLSFKFLGEKHSIRTLIGMLVTSLTIEIAMGLNLSQLTTNMLLTALYGGLTIGLGIGICLRGNGSTGGTDLLAKLIQCKKKHLNMGNIILIVDAIIIACASFTFDSLEIALYAGISLFVMTKVIDFVLDGGRYAKAMFIITDEADKISKYILEKVKRGVTVIDAIGGYSGNNKKILLCVANKREIPMIKEEIKAIDANSFTIVTTVTEAIGNGFEFE